jgi:hypothetical protein
MSKKKTNKINNRKRSLGYYTGGRIMPPKWQLYGYKTEAAYLAYLEEVEQQRVERERRERVINAVLNNVFINFIITIIMNPDQSQRFEAYIRENIRIINNRRDLDPMIDNFVNFARTDLLDEEQRLQINRILDAVQEEREIANRPLGSMEIFEIMERVFRENNDITRSGGGGKKKYYKQFTRKNRFNRRNKNYLPSVL